MSPDYLKLFFARRLSPSEPHHLQYIQSRLASMKAENDSRYEEYSELYKFNAEVSVQPITETVTVDVVEESVGMTEAEFKELTAGEQKALVQDLVQNEGDDSNADKRYALYLSSLSE